MKGEQRCRVEGCRRRQFNYKHGLCKTHTAYFYQGKRIEDMRPVVPNLGQPPLCIVTGCQRKPSQLAMCKTHARYFYTGTPIEAMRPLRETRKPGSKVPCRIEGCDGDMHAHGMCNLHYRRQKEGWSEEELRMPRYRKGFQPKHGKKTTLKHQKETFVMVSLYRQGLTYAQVCERLNALGVKSERGTPLNVHTVRNRCRRFRERHGLDALSEGGLQ